MSEETSIQVNFGRPMPLFPLTIPVLMPQQVVPLHVFEPRYRQLVERALDGSGQLAMAVFHGTRWKQEYHGRPPLRPAVCIGQVVQHERTDDGTFNVLLQGVCRARIVREMPASDKRLYREAMLEPVGLEPGDAERLARVRGLLVSLMEQGSLRQLTAAGPILEFARNDEVPTPALLELVSFTVVTDAETRYRLLAEPDADARAGVIESELARLDRLLRRAASQHPERWPKGCSWN